MGTVDSVKQQKGGFKKVLGLGSVVVFGLAYLAPTAVFNYYGPISVAAKGMYPTCYLITTLAMFFTAFSYAQMAREIPKAGSAYAYAQQALHPNLGFMTGWVMLLDYLLLPMVCYLLIGIYMEAYFPIIPAWLWITLVVAFGFIVNYFGVKLAARVDTVIIAAQIALCAVFAGVCIYSISQGGIDGTANGLFDASAFYNAELFEFRVVLYPAAILCVSFLGFDAVSTFAEESKDPKRDLPRAIMIICLGAGFLFILMSYFSQAVWPIGYTQLEDPDAGIFELLARLPIPNLDIVFLVVDNLASLACALSGLAAVTRIMYSMGRDNTLPKAFFGYMHPKYGVPTLNLLLVSIIGLCAIFFADNMIAGAELISFGAITGFIMVNLSVPFYFYKYKKKKSGNFIKHLLIPVIGILICVMLWINIAPNAKLIGIIWLAIGLVICAINTNFFRKPPSELKLEVDDTED
jgi:amino acid transporter